jgi:hypothetical protein
MIFRSRLQQETLQTFTRHCTLSTLPTPASSDSPEDTFSFFEWVSALQVSSYLPEHGATYGRDDFSAGLSEIARLIKARVGLEVACIDPGGLGGLLPTTDFSAVFAEVLRCCHGLSPPEKALIFPGAPLSKIDITD